MIYLDYSATTPVDERVIDSYVEVTKKYIGNPNSLHKLGIASKNLIDAASKQIADILNIKPSEIIYTSGSTEANNLAIKGVCSKFFNRGKHIIITKLEHSSIINTVEYMKKWGFSVSYVKLDSDGRVDLDDLERLITDDTILVSVASVNSEVGVRQDLKAISKVIRRHPKVLFHSDMTQSIGKELVSLDDVDLASMSGQKFYGMKGIGCLYKKENIVIDPLIHGGKSTTIYRAGTPAVALIVSFSKALRLAYDDFSNKYNSVLKLNEYLISNLNDLDIYINSNKYSVPHIVNISLKNIKAETMLHALEQEDIYISTQTACSTGNYSEAVLAITGSKERASSSLRISLSYLTTKEEIDKFLQIFSKKVKELTF